MEGLALVQAAWPRRCKLQTFVFPTSGELPSNPRLRYTSEFNSPHALYLKINSSSSPLLFSSSSASRPGRGITLSLPRSKQDNKWFLSTDTPLPSWRKSVKGEETGREREGNVRRGEVKKKKRTSVFVGLGLPIVATLFTLEA